MRNLAQVARKAGRQTGKMMPDISPVLAARGIRPRRGQVLAIVGQPNAGKSMLALKYVVDHNLPTLYVSADTDEDTTLHRSLAMLTGNRVDDIEDTFEQGAGELYLGVLDRIDRVQFTFDPTPTMEDIALQVSAFDEVYGRPPELIVIDNLLNIYTGGESAGSWAGMVEVSQFLHNLARRSEGAVWILHHTNEGGSPRFPPPRSAIINKVSHLPELILSVALHEDEYRVACVKNRSGPHDATGHNWVALHAVPERMQLFDTAAEAQACRYWSDLS